MENARVLDFKHVKTGQLSYDEILIDISELPSHIEFEVFVYEEGINFDKLFALEEAKKVLVRYQELEDDERKHVKAKIIVKVHRSFGSFEEIATNFSEKILKAIYPKAEFNEYSVSMSLKTNIKLEINISSPIGRVEEMRMARDLE